MSYKNREYIDYLKEKFNEQNYINFIIDLLNLSEEDLNQNAYSIVPEQKQFQETISNYKYVANYTTETDSIGIFVVKLTDESSQNARSSQRTFISTLLNKYNLDASIVAFYQDNENSWRLSFVKKELLFTDKGLKVEITPARRYSYLVGENEAVHTAQEYLFKLLEIEDRKITLSDIEKVFDVEKVTKKFFEEYKEKYLELKEYLDGNEDFITESVNHDFTSEEFAKKLMGQIVFLYFLQKKGWLGVQIVPFNISFEEYNELISSNDSVSNNLLQKYYLKKDNFYQINKAALREEKIKENIDNFVEIFKYSKYDKPWGTGDKQFVRNMFVNSRLDHKDNFFDEYLEPFFYTGLNEKRNNQYFPLFNCKIPFLNGGLFEPLNNYRWSSAKFNIPDSIFSNEEKDGILDIFDLYNFTIDEEEPLEKDIAVDPEMLGKIFENLLDIKDRKSTGSFYTPREIVHYMCQESLANYLVNKINVSYDDIKEFIIYGDIITQTDWTNIFNGGEKHLLSDSIWNNIILIDKALLDIKIADPAVGSGAFPLGMLNEIVKLRDNISSYLIIQEDLNIIKRESIPEVQLNRDYYSMKLQTIQNSIYAVDLEISAVDIAKLRLWLSLIVDYPNDREPRPLPNLDCKIMQGNSLLDEYEGLPLFNARILNNYLKNYKRNNDEKNIKSVNIQFSLFDSDSDLDSQMRQLIKYQEEYFVTQNPERKNELKKLIEEIQFGMISISIGYDSKKTELIEKLVKKKSKPWFIWQLEFFDVFKNNGGFDIVIGNPPYVDSEHMMKTEDGIIQRNTCNKKFKSAKGNWDLFVVFIELGFELLNNNGLISYIIPNKLISANYTKSLREYMLNKRIIEIRDYSNVNVFKSASVYPVTIVCGNNQKKQDVTMRVMESMEKIAWTNLIKSSRFYSSIAWDAYFSQSNEYTSLIEKIDSNKKLFEYGFEVKGAATVNEAYLMKEIILDLNSDNNALKFVNTGTIDPYKVLWGIKSTQYIKEKYDFPIITEVSLKKDMPNRYEDAKKEKIIIGGMTKKIEAIHDYGKIIAAKSTIEIFKGKFDLRYLIATINSKLMTFYYRLYYNSSSLDGGFYSINREQIEKLPIVYDEKYAEELIKLVDNIEINYDETIIKNIDNIVYKIYGLSENEISMIEKYFLESNL